MTADQWTTLISALALFCGVVGATWTMAGRFGALDGRMHRLEDATRHQFAGVRGSLTVLLRALDGMDGFPRGVALEAALAPWQAEIRREEQQANPLTREELARFQRYYDKVSRRMALERAEFEDCQALADKLYRDRPDDPNTWVLVGLGTMLPALGLVRAAG